MYPYIPGTIACTTILKKITGDITVVCFDSGTGLPEKTLRFDIFIQVLEGTAELVIDGNIKRLSAGEGIIVPAHASIAKHAIERFKMIRTVIKSGYEL